MGSFDLDPCCADYMPWETAKNKYIKKDDGLSKEWYGRVWCNPPFNRYLIGDWFKKMSEHKSGILLGGAAMEAKRFKEYVYPNMTGILFMDHRPYFYDEFGSRGKANCGQTICLIAFDDLNLKSLIDSKLGMIMVKQ